MKIKSLKIHNIASIADAFIDFDAPALSDADIFLITGDTGSGKSTILDCICLALYNTAPRLKGTLMEGRLEQKGDYNGISISDPRQLLRRNAGEGYVELIFEGNNGKVYTARWSTQRAYCRPTGRLQKVIHNFVCGRHTFASDTLREERLQAVGVGYDEFVRTTMLAQGEFTRFLNCSDKEKADVLMQILNVDAYEKISRRIHLRTSAEKETLDSLQARADSLELLAPEQKQVFEDERISLQERCGILRKTREENNVRLKWFADEAETAAGLLAASSALDAARRACETEKFIVDSQFLTAYDASSEVLGLLRQIFDVRKSLRNCLLQRISLKEKYAGCKASLIQLEAQISENERQSGVLDHWFDENRVFETTVSRSMLVAQNVRNYFVASRNLAANGSRLAELLKEFDLCSKEKELAVKKVEAAAAAVLKERTALEAVESRLKEKNPDALQKKENELTERAAALEVARNLARNFTVSLVDYEEAARHAQTLREALKADSAAVEVADAGCKQAKEALEQQQKLYDKSSQSLSDWSRRMRGELTVGDICPVCRRRIEEAFESDEQIAQALEPLRIAVKNAERVYLEAQDRLNSLLVEQTARKVLSDKADKEVELRHAQSLSAKAAVDGHCSTLGVSVDEIETSAEKCASDRESLRPLQAEARELKEKCDAARRALDLRIKEKEAADRVLKGIDDTLAGLSGRKASLEALSSSEKAQMDKYSSELESDVSGPWKCVWRERPKEFLAELDAAVAARVKADEKKELLAREHERLSAAAALCRSAENEILELMPSWHAEIPESRPLPRIESEFPTLKAQTEANIALEKELMGKLRTLKSAVDEMIDRDGHVGIFPLCRMLRKSSEEIQTIRREVENVKKAFSEASAVFENLRKRRETLLADRPEMSEEETAESLGEKLKAADVEIDTCVARLAVIEETFRRDRELRMRQAGIIAEIEKQKGILADWQQLDRHFGSADGRQFSKIALRYVLGHLLEKANVYLRKIMPRYRLECRPDSFIIMVEDAYQNGALRSANVISGGESFIVSLVLALALSDIGSRLKVDILFIDEGFGTLSGDALESAVETLRSLRGHGGRRVGIISHVAELRERIPVKISVKREGQAASTVSLDLG